MTPATKWEATDRKLNCSSVGKRIKHETGDGKNFARENSTILDTVDLDLLKMLGKDLKKKHILPNGGLMVIYHATKDQNHKKKNTSKLMEEIQPN